MTSTKVPNRRLEILLVENDEVDVLSLQRAFDKFDIRHRITVVHNGSDALETLGREHQSPNRWTPNLILLDIAMPGMDGLEFLRRLRSEPDIHKIPVFIFTSSDEPSDRAFAYQYHVSGYIVKPMDYRQYEQVIFDLNRFWEHNQFPSIPPLSA